MHCLDESYGGRARLELDSGLRFGRDAPLACQEGGACFFDGVLYWFYGYTPTNISENLPLRKRDELVHVDYVHAPNETPAPRVSQRHMISNRHTVRKRKSFK